MEATDDKHADGDDETEIEMQNALEIESSDEEEGPEMSEGIAATEAEAQSLCDDDEINASTDGRPRPSVALYDSLNPLTNASEFLDTLVVKVCPFPNVLLVK